VLEQDHEGTVWPVCYRLVVVPRAIHGGRRCPRAQVGLVVDAALAVLVVSEGIASSPKGVQAAEKACSVLTSRFEQAVEESENAEQALASAVRATDADVYRAFDGKGSAASSLRPFSRTR